MTHITPKVVAKPGLLTNAPFPEAPGVDTLDGIPQITDQEQYDMRRNTPSKETIDKMDGIKEQILARKLQVLEKRPSPEKYEYLQTKRRKKAMQEYNNG